MAPRSRLFHAGCGAKPVATVICVAGTGLRVPYRARPGNPLWPLAGSVRYAVVASRGVWRSLVACFVRDEEVVGSNPATPTVFWLVGGPISLLRGFHQRTRYVFLASFIVAVGN
jgi:hypothetical protein